MTKPIWIVSNDWSMISNQMPDDLARVTGLPLQYTEAIVDPLEWGPHHPDLKAQALLRAAYHWWDWNDAARAEAIRDATLRGEEVLLWGLPELRSFLTRIWLLGWLVASVADLSRVRLVLDPLWRWQTGSRTAPEEVAALIDGALPVGDCVDELIAIRRHLASDSEQIQVHVSGLSPPVTKWAEVGNRMGFLFPDQRGLDWFDSLLLEQLADDWQRVGWVVGSCILGCCQDFRIGQDWLWQRLTEMSDQSDWLTSCHEPQPLCELRFGGHSNSAVLSAEVRITELGKSVRDGQDDALRHRSFFRWVGGRLLTNERLIRFEGSYREQTPRRWTDPVKRPE